VNLSDGAADEAGAEAEVVALAVAAQSEGAWDETLARMQRAFRMVDARGGALSFDTNIPDPERELFRSIQTADPEAVHFSSDVDSDEKGDDEPNPAAAGSKISAVLNRLLERAGAVTRIETRVDGRLIAATTVGLTGDCYSALGDVDGDGDGRLAPERNASLDAHLNSLRVELQARRARTTLVLSTMQMAAKLALAMGTGNPLLALPAAWKFIRGVLAERKQIEQPA